MILVFSLTFNIVPEILVMGYNNKKRNEIYRLRMKILSLFVVNIFVYIENCLCSGEYKYIRI